MVILNMLDQFIAAKLIRQLEQLQTRIAGQFDQLIVIGKCVLFFRGRCLRIKSMLLV